MIFRDRDSRRPQISGARIIAEALPGMENIILGGGGQDSDGRKAPQPFIIIWNDSRNLGLLEHEFGDENCVGIGGSAPGKITLVPAVPGKKRSAEGRIRFDEENVGRLHVRSNDFLHSPAHN